MTSPPLSPALWAGGPETGTKYGACVAIHSGLLPGGQHVEPGGILPPEHSETPRTTALLRILKLRRRNGLNNTLHICYAGPGIPNLHGQHCRLSKRCRGFDRRSESSVERESADCTSSSASSPCTVTAPNIRPRPPAKDDPQNVKAIRSWNARRTLSFAVRGPVIVATRDRFVPPCTSLTKSATDNGRV